VASSRHEITIVNFPPDPTHLFGSHSRLFSWCSPSGSGREFAVEKSVAASGYAEGETHNLKDFIQANLRKAVFVVPDKEIEIQNGIESLMVGRGMAKGTDYDA
jgi:hypothetical protein